MTNATNTAQDLASLEALRASMSGIMSISQTQATEMYRAGLIGILRRDMQKAAGEDVSFFDLNKISIERGMIQTDWRDQEGFQVSDKRAAEFVAKWAAKYLDPRDADGNSWTPILQERNGGFFIITHSHKISP